VQELYGLDPEAAQCALAEMTRDEIEEFRQKFVEGQATGRFAKKWTLLSP
jgi:hypothetical protein